MIGVPSLIGETVPEFPSPLAFIEKQRGAMRIVAVDETALALGIAPGMMLADARARVRDLIAVPHDPPADAMLLEHIAEDCDRYTPMVALDPPDGLILDITGCAPIWGGEMGLVSALAARLVHAGFTIRIALAETPDKARALVRHGGELLSAGRRTPPEALNESRLDYAAEPRVLPVAALDLDEKGTTALRRAGLYTIGDLASRPRTPVAARFGAGAATKLARVLGEEDRRIVPSRRLPAMFAMQRFAEPVTRTFYLNGIIGELGGEVQTLLRERGEGGRRFILSLFRSDGDTRRLAIETGAPAHDPALLVRLFGERIETLADPLDPGFGYDAIRLDVAASEPLAPAQPGFERGAEGTVQLNALIDRLSTRLGPRRVRRFVAGDTHIPEQAAFTTPATAPALPLPWPESEPGEPPARPVFLFDPPQPIEVIAEVPDGPPRHFRWRRGSYHVVAHEGPERIASEWWRRKGGHEPGKGGLTRDYYRVEDREGRRFWLFRHGLYGTEQATPGWYLHGRFG